MNAMLKFWPFRMAYLLRKVFLTRATRVYYSQYGEDIVYDRIINLNRKGFFVDVGCHHPTKYNNTFKLYCRGWRGINIDLDPLKIEAFQLRRPADLNLACGVSDVEGEVTCFSQGTYTVTETIDPASAEKMRQRGIRLREFQVRTRPLTAILDETPYKNRMIDILTVDVEGVELAVLRSLDFERYCPKLIVVESHERTIERILNDETYRFLLSKGYSLFNWTGPSLLFVHPRELR